MWSELLGLKPRAEHLHRRNWVVSQQPGLERSGLSSHLQPFYLKHFSIPKALGSAEAR